MIDMMMLAAADISIPAVAGLSAAPIATMNAMNFVALQPAIELSNSLTRYQQLDAGRTGQIYGAAQPSSAAPQPVPLLAITNEGPARPGKGPRTFKPQAFDI